VAPRRLAWGGGSAPIVTPRVSEFGSRSRTLAHEPAGRSDPPEGFESQALAVVEGGLQRGVDPRLIKRAARLLQGYEKLYWDTLLARARR
jgi:hypothetical protein